MDIFSDKRKLAALVPAHNEEKVIGETLSALRSVIPKDDIYLVDDGSSDNTVAFAKYYVDNILVLSPNVGKATAMNKAISYFLLSERYDYILPMDADTKVTKEFIDLTTNVMEDDIKHKISCVVGKVVGKIESWVTLYRLWEYEVAQTIHKSAQSSENAIIVCPGCATLYRSSVFRYIEIPIGTLTEDMDFTFLIHRKHLGKISFQPNAVVITQDPLTFADFIKQIDRWYTGFWQCVVKNNIPWGGQSLDLEVSLLASEGLFNGMLVTSLVILIPFSLIKNPYLLVVPFLFDLLFFVVPTMFLTAKKHKYGKIFLYIPLFYFARFVSSLIFLKSFFKIILGFDRAMSWNKATRYKII